ncbi:MAG: NAD(P)H-hydrate epimerase, partial [Nitrospira sp.]|nr:NAD(P)H-hydrate epimerase [Nitrospira sp.]
FCERCSDRHLANHGIDVRLCLAEPDHLQEVPAFQRHIFRSTQGREVDVASLHAEPVDLILDGLIGYGLRSVPRGSVAELIRWANGTGAPILALDVPSGLDSTTGHRPGDYVQPYWTMTLALPKTGLLPENTGQLFLADIGIPEQTYRRLGLSYVNPFAKGFWVPLICR